MIFDTDSMTFQPTIEFRIFFGSLLRWIVIEILDDEVKKLFFPHIICTKSFLTVNVILSWSSQRLKNDRKYTWSSNNTWMQYRSIVLCNLITILIQCSYDRHDKLYRHDKRGKLRISFNTHHLTGHMCSHELTRSQLGHAFHLNKFEC